MKENVIFDLDGTLANIKHRRHLVENGKEEWDEFFKQCVYDTPNQDVVNISRIFALNKKMNIFILSGRSEIVYHDTMAWLGKHGVKFSILEMRKDGNKESDMTLKKKMIEQHNLTPDNTLCVFEDRDRLVKMWRELGFTCCQVAEGDF